MYILVCCSIPIVQCSNLQQTSIGHTHPHFYMVDGVRRQIAILVIIQLHAISRIIQLCPFICIYPFKINMLHSVFTWHFLVCCNVQCIPVLPFLLNFRSLSCSFKIFHFQHINSLLLVNINLSKMDPLKAGWHKFCYLSNYSVTSFLRCSCFCSWIIVLLLVNLSLIFYIVHYTTSTGIPILFELVVHQ